MRKRGRDQQVAGFRALREHHAIWNLVWLYRDLHVPFVAREAVAVDDPLHVMGVAVVRPHAYRVGLG